MCVLGNFFSTYHTRFDRYSGKLYCLIKADGQDSSNRLPYKVGLGQWETLPLPVSRPDFLWLRWYHYQLFIGGLNVANYEYDYDSHHDVVQKLTEIVAGAR